MTNNQPPSAKRPAATATAAARANANESEVMAFGGKPTRASTVHHGRMVQAKK